MRGSQTYPIGPENVKLRTEVLIANISVLLMELTLMLLLSHSGDYLGPLHIVLLPTLRDAG